MFGDGKMFLILDQAPFYYLLFHAHHVPNGTMRVMSERHGRARYGKKVAIRPNTAHKQGIRYPYETICATIRVPRPIAKQSIARTLLMSRLLFMARNRLREINTSVPNAEIHIRSMERLYIHTDRREYIRYEISASMERAENHRSS